MNTSAGHGAAAGDRPLANVDCRVAAVVYSAGSGLAPLGAAILFCRPTILFDGVMGNTASAARCRVGTAPHFVLRAYNALGLTPAKRCSQRGKAGFTRW